MTQAYSIKAEGLRVEKDKKIILDGLDFAVRPGTVTGLIGPSGSGKTTLIRTIVGVQKASGGTLGVLGKPAGSSELRSKIGYVTQGASVYSDLTVVQNLRYFAALTAANRAQINETLDQVQLVKQRDQLVSSLSGGQQARVGLAVALLGNPDLLIMDEPTVGLDPLLREELWQLFAGLAARGKTLLVSSHVMDEAEKCNDLLLLRDGQLLWHDSRQSLLARTKTTSVQAAFMSMIKEEQ
jgi:ABC-2 type transport system ATP-binding protein